VVRSFIRPPPHYAKLASRLPALLPPFFLTKLLIFGTHGLCHMAPPGNIPSHFGVLVITKHGNCSPAPVRELVSSHRIFRIFPAPFSLGPATCGVTCTQDSPTPQKPATVFYALFCFIRLTHFRSPQAKPPPQKFPDNFPPFVLGCFFVHYLALGFPPHTGVSNYFKPSLRLSQRTSSTVSFFLSSVSTLLQC